MEIFVGILFFMGCLLSIFIERWPKWVLPKVFLNRSFLVENCYVGDVLPLTWKVSNAARFPISWIKFDTEFSPHMTVDDVVSDGKEWVDFRGISRLPAKSDLIYNYTCTFNKRGYYLFRDVKFDTVDYLGIKKYEGNLCDRLSMYVYPNIKPIDLLLDKSQQLMGDKEVRRWIVEDPLIHVGSREYSSGDPMKSIHWNATAQTGKMQVKKFAYTTEISAMLLINSQTKDHFWQGAEDELLERMVETAASYVSRFEKNNEGYGLSSNCPIQEGASGVMISVAKGRKHYHKIFRALSQMSHYASCGMENIIDYSTRLNPRSTRMVVITGVMSDRMMAAIRLGIQKGFDFEIITTKAVVDFWAPSSPKMIWHVFREDAHEC